MSPGQLNQFGSEFIVCNLIKQPADLRYLPVEPLPKEVQCIIPQQKGALLIKPPIV
jgi:hypothetical protein